MRPHSPAWLPKASNSRSVPWAIRGRHRPRFYFPVCHKCHVPRKFNQLPVGKFMFPSGNQILFKALPTGQGKPDPTPDLCKKLVWGEQRRLRAEGAGASGLGRVLGSRLGAPRAFVCAGAAAPANPPAPPATGTRQPHGKGQSRVRGPRAYPSPRPPVGIRHRGTGTRRVVPNRILLFVLLNLLDPSRDTPRPQRQSGSPSPHIWRGADCQPELPGAAAETSPPCHGDPSATPRPRPSA